MISTGRILPHAPGSKGRIQEFFLQIIKWIMLVALVAVKLDDVFEPKVFREKPGGMRHHVSDFWARRRFVSKLLKMELVRLLAITSRTV